MNDRFEDLSELRELDRDELDDLLVTGTPRERIWAARELVTGIEPHPCPP